MNLNSSYYEHLETLKKNGEFNDTDVKETIQDLTYYISKAGLDPSVYCRRLMKHILRHRKFRSAASVKEFDYIICLLCYESVEHINFLLDNISKYNSDFNYLIVLHGNDAVFQSRYELRMKNLIICPFHFNKERHTSSLLLGIMDCVKFSIKCGFKCHAYHLFSSSCLFIKKQIKERFTFPPEELEPVDIPEARTIDKPSLSKSKFNMKQELFDMLKERNIFDYYGHRSYNSFIYPAIITNKVSEFFEKYVRKHLINLQPSEDCAYEEKLLNTLHSFFWKNKKGMLRSTSCKSFNCRGGDGHPLTTNWVKDVVLGVNQVVIKMINPADKRPTSNTVDYHEVMRHLKKVEDYDSVKEEKLREEASKRVNETIKICQEKLKM